MSLVDEHAKIDIEIVNAVIACTDENWDKFTVILQYNLAENLDEIGSVSVSISHEIQGHETPSDEVFLAVQKLNLLFYRHGVEWISAEYRIFLNSDNKWAYEADFQY